MIAPEATKTYGSPFHATSLEGAKKTKHRRRIISLFIAGQFENLAELNFDEQKTLNLSSIKDLLNRKTADFVAH